MLKDILRGFARRALLSGVALGLVPAPVLCQTNPADWTPSADSYFGSITVAPATTQVQQLSLDDAIRMGIQHNLALLEAQAEEKAANARALMAMQPLLPLVTADASRGAHQFNLEARGFTPQVVQQFSSLLPGTLTAVPLVVKADVVQAHVNFAQTLFSLPSIDRYRAAKSAAKSAFYGTQSSRGLVVLHVGSAYLDALAAGSRVDDARALLATDRLLRDQAVARYEAGVAPHLDELRARVEYAAQQQRTIVAENNFRKAKILLKREIGLPAEQPIQLTDVTPYSELTTMDLPEAKRLALENRQDYQRMLTRVRTADLQREAARWERLPSLSFHGDYGVTGIAHGLYHGDFAAVFTLNVPVFHEAKFRADRRAAEIQVESIEQQLNDLKQQIEQQLRDSMLDVQSTERLVGVARSNAELAQQELDQARERFSSGVSDNLPVVQAQAVLQTAQSNLISTTVAYNQSKLGLARNLGIIDSQYRRYLGK